MDKKVRDISNISDIVNEALCTACGACAGICPVHAVRMYENPAGFINAKVDEAICVECKKCFNICPSNGQLSDDDYIGKIINGYIGYASDGSVRCKSQSGGIVTALLLYLLERQLIDGAVVTRFNCRTRRPECFLAETAEDILASAGSCYSQTFPIETILKNQDKRLAAVVLGCQAESMRQIKDKYPGIQLPLYTIGLICGGNLSGRMIDDILSQGGADDKDIIHTFRFRDKECGGWPGDITFTTDKKHQFPKEKRMELKPHYQNYRCLLCADKMNLYCDLVVGDPWGIPIEDKQKGYSAIITRTNTGEQLLEMAYKEKAIYITKQFAQSILDGQQIDNELIKRHNLVHQISLEQEWRFPYRNGVTMPENTSLDLYNRLYNKMRYSRELHLCNNEGIAKRMIYNHKKQDNNLVREWLYSLKKKIIKFVYK